MAHVGLFVPCYLAALRPADRQHATRVLEALGDTVVGIEGYCCGQPAFNSGFRDDARKVTREALRAAQPFSTVVVLSGSCTSMVQHYAPMLWDGPRSTAVQRIGERFFEFTQYVAGHSHLGDLGLRLAETIAYHDSCHNRRELQGTEVVVSLLESIEGLDLRRLQYEEECCGFGGTFNLKFPVVAGGMAGSKLADVRATGAPTLVSTDVSCLTHLERASGGEMPEALSIAELLARALPE
ncbi:MAG: (Fe-S)-binding protein [Dehalococcoidia bacterium]|nr:(Fe-S)-binding protein [Dehalococcoidia bacterium]MCA9843573.1 (Fe-S)-binding protein [Dehalococcoidia bacterium]